MKRITAERLRELLHYDPDTGDFTRLMASQSRPDTLGPIKARGNHLGYILISVDGQQYQAHRLAFLYMTGAWPRQSVDHINGDGRCNRWVNLRDVSTSVNLQNQRQARADNSQRLLGVYRNHRRFMARITTATKRNMYLGTFDTPEEAHQAYLMAKRRFHAGCTL